MHSTAMNTNYLSVGAQALSMKHREEALLDAIKQEVPYQLAYKIRMFNSTRVIEKNIGGLPIHPNRPK
jgi:hypothetical protein